MNHQQVQLALRGRLLTVPGLPTARAWENVTFSPTTGTAYVEEEYVPGPSEVVTLLLPRGQQHDMGLYVVRCYTPAGGGYGAAVTVADAILTRFAPGTQLTTSAGDVVRVRADVAPFRGAIRQTGDGWAVVPVTIPWRTYTLTPA